MRQRAQERKNEEMEIMEVEEEGKSGEESESESEYEEYTDSEDEAEPRLKPVFIRKYVFLSGCKYHAACLVRLDYSFGLQNICCKVKNRDLMY